ncbi:putative disease resistance RPP13-like protein 3 [Apium graveolens]|uniref:putative disease resistance RPP13-like protein 3 n=1 Tax=Apium graveolens TaxID=4045 RepID=UPI003D793CC2
MNKRVAEMADDKCFVHKLRFLTEDESWQLFCKRAEPTTPNLKKLGREMAGKRRGLPLEIVILSGLLLHNRTNDFWLKMRDCFLYLARYPEDYVISSKELKLLWIAEEFLSQGEGVVMEDLVIDYLNELINHNLLQVNDFRFNGQVKRCRVHDLVRDPAISKAKEKNLL